MIKNAFKLVPKYKSGIGQLTVNGKMTEVKAVKFTLNKKFIDSSRYGKLNNHEGLQGENEKGEVRIMLFTTQKNSKSFLEENKKDNNNLVSNENICGNNQRAQYISDTSIDPDDGTYKTTYSERTEKYTRKHAHFLTNHFNDRWGKKVVGLKNIKKEQNE